MKDYGLQRSAVKPSEREFTETKVFVYTDIKEVVESSENGDINLFEFNMIEYDKDEFIELLSDKNKSLESEITEIQLALCDVYERQG
jgi:hypothetical protein|nr:MAG TPA: hypothetical protein [Caudoviricetes sp.]